MSIQLQESKMPCAQPTTATTSTTPLSFNWLALDNTTLNLPPLSFAPSPRSLSHSFYFPQPPTRMSLYGKIYDVEPQLDENIDGSETYFSTFRIVDEESAGKNVHNIIKALNEQYHEIVRNSFLNNFNNLNYPDISFSHILPVVRYF